MNIPLGITVTAVTAAAVTQLSALGRSLLNLGGPAASAASQGFGRWEQTANAATRSVTEGLNAAENAWWKLGGAFGVPMSLAGILGAVSGIRGLKGAIIDANVAMETTQARMGAMLRDWNDSKESARLKAAGVSAFVENYAGTTPFDQQGVTEAAVAATMYTKDPRAVEEATKLAAKLAAYKGTNDIAWSAQALQSAMNGDTSSLRMSFGINVSQDQLQQQAMMSGYGNTMRGRFEAIKRMIEMRAGTDDQIVQDLAKTGLGATNVLQDSFAVPLRKLSEPAYKEGVAALVRFNDSMSKFQDSEPFEAFMTQGQAFFGEIGKGIGKGVDFLADNLERIPTIIQKYGPVITTVAKVAGGIAALGAASLALHGTLLLAQSSVAAFTRFLHPMLLLVGNPLLVAGLVALATVMWPTAKSLEIGGKSLDAWMDKAEKWSAGKDWKAIFLQVPEAISAALGEVKKTIQGEQSFDEMLTAWFGGDSFLGRVRNILAPIGKGLRDAVAETLAGTRGQLTTLQAANPEAVSALQAVGGAYQQFSRLVASGWTLLGQAAEQASPALERAANFIRDLLPDDLQNKNVQLTGLGLGIGLLGASLVKLALFGPGLAGLARILPIIGGAVTALVSTVGLPALAAGAALLYPFVQQLEIGGKSLDGWLAKLGQLSEGVNWEGIFSMPLKYLRTAIDWLTGKSLTGEVDIVQWWKNLIAPDSLIGRIGAILKPIWDGLLKALDDAFPELDGWFSRTFGSLARDLGNIFSTIVNTVGPVVEGLLKSFQNIATVLGPVVGELTKFILAFAGTAWNAVERALEWLAKATGSRESRDSLERFAKSFADLAIVIGTSLAAIKGAQAAGRVAAGISSVAGAARANPAMARGMALGAITIAAATIMATSVKMYTETVDDNINRTAMWNVISGIKSMDDKVGGGVIGLLLDNIGKKEISNKEPDKIRAYMSELGALGAVLGVDLASLHIKAASYTAANRTLAFKAADAGEGVGNTIMSQIAGLQGRDDLSKAGQSSLASVLAAQDKLTQLWKEKQDTGKLNEKEFSRLTNVLFRNVGALENMGYLNGIFPSNIAESLKVLGWDTRWGEVPYTPGTFKPDYDPSGGGGGGGFSGQVIPAYDPRGGQGGGASLPDIHLTIHATTKDGVDAEHIAQAVRRELQVALSQAMNGGV